MSHLKSPLRRKYCGCKYSINELKLYEKEEPRVISPVRRPVLSPRRLSHLDQDPLSLWDRDIGPRKVPTSPRRLYLE